MTDGPHGVRANRTGPEREQGPATSFPTGISMAASWDPALIERVGAALAEETLALGCDILLGPCVNIVRTPLAGRNFESYSEDPYLAGKIGIGWINGLQSKGVGASLKHYACNNQEIERMRGNAIVDERTLREIYLRQFEMIVKETEPWTVMCAYNRINGAYASQNTHLQQEILKGEWQYDGVIVSDWGANHTTTESVTGGLDIEMPGPAKYYGHLLVEAVLTWQIEESAIDEAARRILRMIVKSDRMNRDRSEFNGAINTPGHQTLARELAEASITLLKNERAILPLDDVESIAVIGPNASEARIGGGGSSYLEPPYRISPFEGLKDVYEDEVTLTYAPGCENSVEPPALKPNLPPQGKDEPGFWGTYYATDDLTGEPVAERLDAYLDDWRINPPAGVSPEQFSASWVGHFTVSQQGRYSFEVRHAGSCKLRLDGECLIDSEMNDTPEPDVTSAQAYAVLESGKTYTLNVEFRKPRHAKSSELRVRAAYKPKPEDDDRLDRAVELASQADVAVIFAGMPKGYESEGHDRPHMKLPGDQDALIQAVADSNPNTIVVLNCGSPVEMPWIEQVPGVVLAYYPGQEGGRALARVLTGAVNPSGKLPVTFPKHYRDNPTILNYPGTKEVRYGEGIFVGYRYYDEKQIAPLFPFGHGLSYTTFEYDKLQMPAAASPGESIAVSITLKNTGPVAGREVVQLYVRDPESSLVRPPQELRRFQKVFLEPGAETKVSFQLEDDAMAFYDPYQGEWVVEPGQYEIRIGSSSHDIRLTGAFELKEPAG
jgi:beta-glucosidase